MKTILSICTILIVTNCEVDFTYNHKIAYTEDGLECINNCVNGKCNIDATLEIRDCQNTDKDVTVHRTIHDEMCLSRCVQDPDYTGKCFIDQNGIWDYCESSRSVEWIRDKVFTEGNGPCKETCRPSCKNGCFTCYHYWQGVDSCDPQRGHNYIQARTITGELCRGSCSRNHGREYRCAYGMRNEEACALPGMPRQRDWSKEIEELLKVKKPLCIRVQDIDRCRSGGEDLKNVFLHNLALDLEGNLNYNTIYLRSNAYPVYSFTYQRGNVVLPRVVRAVIHPRDLIYSGDPNNIPEEVRENLRKMGIQHNDVVGYLVSYYMSGPQEHYNLYNRKLDTDHNVYYRMFDFLEDNQHLLNTKVELLIVVLYREGEVRPSGIAKNVKFYHSNSLVDEYYEYLPNDSGEITETSHSQHIKENSLLPPVNITLDLQDGDCYSYSYNVEPKYDIDIRNS